MAALHGLCPLYGEFGDYPVFAPLFGVRNDLGREPLAARRGLPGDASAAVRTEFEEARRLDAAVPSPTSVSWAELARADLAASPAGLRGVVLLREPTGEGGQVRGGYAQRRFWVGERWGSAVLVRRMGPGVGGWIPAELPFGERSVGATRVTYRPFTLGDAVGPGTGWEHVFAVMAALAGRFGDHGVRLVVYFD
ncbi:hypothetical protein [Kitasatospora sp. SolWspMP-SS2h]|uniref:hypothetical protein n=1 Tax=Kitasatospora sp. SolWspMP-SS2h TaxID=1305729 RepID=UPI0011B94B9E|nr:hypothetical protein [Kitasatospora sp. SolWspMP-SS2h]